MVPCLITGGLLFVVLPSGVEYLRLRVYDYPNLYRFLNAYLCIFFFRVIWLLVEFYPETRTLKVVSVIVSVPITLPPHPWWWLTP